MNLRIGHHRLWVSISSAGLFFEHFQKSQGLPKKTSSRPIFREKFIALRPTLDFGQKTMKLEILGAHFEMYLVHFYFPTNQILHSLSLKNRFEVLKTKSDQ